ncbi:MAG: hypothetical protein AAF804_10990 [Bacteroidota bacterium]
MKHFITLMVWVCCGKFFAYGQNRTQPILEFGPTRPLAQGSVTNTQAAWGFSAGVGMWKFNDKKLEWAMNLRYHYQDYSFSGHEVLSSNPPAEVEFIAHRLDWSTLAVFHLAKPYFNLQGGILVGMGLGSRLSEEGLSFDPGGRIPMSPILQRGDFSYGPIIGLGGGIKSFQVHLRYLWDLRDYLPIANANLQRPYLTLGFTWVIPGVEIY